MQRVTSWLTAVVGVLVFVDLYLAFLWSPKEAEMGDLIRIMYFHVACAWIAFFAFFITFVYAILYLIRRKMRYDTISLASAEIGLIYTSVTLVTGSLWAKPIWNTWWTWDPRLTTTLILWFLYIGYLLLRGTVSGLERRARVAAVYAIIAFVDVPIIHLSVEWWRSIHPQVIDDTGVNMPGTMVFTLMFGFLTFLFLYCLMLVLRVQQESQKLQLYAIREAYRSARSNINVNRRA